MDLGRAFDRVDVASKDADETDDSCIRYPGAKYNQGCAAAAENTHEFAVISREETSCDE